MALRKIVSIEGPNGTFNVLRCNEWNEFIVRAAERRNKRRESPEDYYCGDRGDAVATANLLAGRTA